jgi:hypothetical protein
MNAVVLAAFGWLVPGGTYLLMRRYLQFAVFAIVVWTAFGAGIALQGGLSWPQPAELAGLNTSATWILRAGALSKPLAGGPYLAAQVFGWPGSFLEGRVHEYGTTLLMMAGLFNVLAISTAFDLRKERAS